MKKYLSLLILLVFAFISNVYAIPETEDRTTLENYGVNKKWEITDFNKANVLRTKEVKKKKKIYDFKDVLTEEEETNLKSQIDSFVEKYNMDLVLLIDDLEYTYDSANEEYAADFYDYNDFGIDFEKYSGIVLFRNTYEKDKYYDMYTFGNCQLYFDNYRYDDILDSIYNDLHDGNYYDGFSTFISKTSNYISSGRPSGLINYEVDDNGYLYEIPVPRVYRIPWEAILPISFVITLVTMIILIKKNKMVKKAVTAEEYLLKNTINITKRQDLFVSSHTTSYTESHDSGGSGGGGGFSSSGGSSGGGHSSGGGRHG